jgi:NAD(P)-dependent dehydrogenase (short-subunit alcohol dehydrogenase family)
VDLDMKEPDQVGRMLGEVTERLEPVDVLVNNAGVCYHRLAAEVPRDE